MTGPDHASEGERTHENDTPRRTTAPVKEADATSGETGTAPAHAAAPDTTRSPGAASLGARQVKAKTVVGEANDPAERDADRAADRALRLAAPQQDRPTAVDPTVADATSIGPGAAISIPAHMQRSPPALSASAPGPVAQPPVPASAPQPLLAPPSGATPTAPIRGQAVANHDPHGGHAVPPETERYLDQSQGTGSPLSDGTRRYFEARFSTDFRLVRVHNDDKAGQAAQSIGAQAFTRGRDIWFSPGAYDPATDGGRRLLGHELAHVAQQNPGIGRRTDEPPLQVGGRPASADRGNAASEQEDAKTTSAPGVTRTADLQRQAVPEGKDTTNLDALIARVSDTCDAFATFKTSPLTGETMPGMDQSLQMAAARFGEIETWMNPYARNKLGPLRLKLLQEMISVTGTGWPEYDNLFGIAYQVAGHKYTLELKGATTVVEKTLAKLFPVVTITYTNAFQWHWSRDYRLEGLAFGVKASGEAEYKDKKLGVKPGGGSSWGPIQLDIKGSASADPTPIRYCGGDDFTGLFTVATGASTFKVGPAGGSLGALTAISFHGTPQGDVNFPFISGVDASVSASLKAPELDVSIGMAAGKSAGLGETKVEQPPELQEVVKLANSYRIWALAVGFDTGKADPTKTMGDQLDQLRKTVEKFKHDQLDPQADELRKQSIDPEQNFRLHFEVTGMASRRWRGATNADRLKLNQLLSERRAATVETEIYNRFPEVFEVDKSGTGAHAVGAVPGWTPENPEGGGTPPLLDDAAAQALYEEKKKQAMALTDPWARRVMLAQIEDQYGPNSDDDLARRAVVICEWDGLMIMKVLEPVPPMTPATGP